MSNIILRFAPSPTGPMHIGSIRSALFNYLFAMKNNGNLLLRIDDTDSVRSNVVYTEQIERCLSWSGITYKKTKKQSERFDRYHEVIEKLKQSGKIYPCYETAEELEQRRKLAITNGRPPIYKRQDAQKNSNITPYWRLDTGNTIIHWNDAISNEMKIDCSNLSDPVLIDSDNRPLYTLASVVDDIDYDITHIFRGRDHVTNTATQLALMDAIIDVYNMSKDKKRPNIGHFPLLFSKEGKMSKRDGESDSSVINLIEKIEPMVLNSVLSTFGNSGGYRMFYNMSDLIQHFNMNDVSAADSIFSTDDLYHFNEKWLHGSTYNDVKSRVEDKYGDFNQYWDIVKYNINKLSDLSEWQNIINNNIQKIQIDTGSIENLQLFISILKEYNSWHDIEKQCKQYKNWKDIYKSVRISTIGQEKGPTIKDIFAMFGHTDILKRCEAYL